MTTPSVGSPARGSEFASESADQIGTTVSVVMPVLNEEHYLATSVGAVLNQDFEGSLEVILALGPSTDATDRVAARLCAADSRVKTVANPNSIKHHPLSIYGVSFGTISVRESTSCPAVCGRQITWNWQKE